MEIQGIAASDAGIAIFEIILIPILIAINAFFTASEMALARVRRTRIDQLVEEGNKAAEVAQNFLHNPDKFISACQLGITLATLALGAVGEKAFADDLVHFMISSGLSAAWSVALMSAARAFCYVFAFSLTAFIQTVFGELVPKTLTFERAEMVMLGVVLPMKAWQWLVSPFIYLLNGFTTFVLKLFNVKEAPRHHFVHSEEEIKMLVTASQEGGVIEEEEEEMLHSVFEFSDTVAQEVMTPRTDMVCVSANAPISEFVDLALKHGLSRLPVFEEDIDNIFGMVHIRDGLRALVEHKQATPVRELSRKVLIVPENKSVGDLLTEFKKTKTHMAIVVDEYGSTRGLVTIEDLIEELVGDIADEHEIVEDFITQQEDGSYLVDSKISLDEANEKLALEIEDEQFNTLGGHVFGILGREPKVGDEVETDHYTIRIEEADRHRIMKLRLIARTVHADEPNGGGKDGASSENKSESRPVESGK